MFSPYLGILTKWLWSSSCTNWTLALLLFSTHLTDGPRELDMVKKLSYWPGRVKHGGDNWLLCKAATQSTWYMTWDTVVIVYIATNINQNCPRMFWCLQERRDSVVVSTSAWHAIIWGSILGPGALLGVKTWLSTLETVYIYCGAW